MWQSRNDYGRVSVVLAVLLLSCAIYTSSEASKTSHNAATSTWTSHGPFEQTAFDLRAEQLFTDPHRTTTLYANTNLQGFGYKSSDGGSTWTSISDGSSGCNSFVIVKAILATVPTTIFAELGDCGLHKSTDGGRTWTTAKQGLPTTARPHIVSTTPADQHVLYTTVYVQGETESTTYEAVYLSANDGMTWQEVGELRGTLLYSLVIDPVTATTLYAGGDDGIYNSVDGGRNWSKVFAYQVGTLVIDPTVPSTLYAIHITGYYGASLIKSVDGGITWSAKHELGGHFFALGIGAQTTTTLYVGHFGAVEKSTDGGTTWATVTIPLEQNCAARDFLILSQTPTTVYVAACNVYTSTDDGSTWQTGDANGFGSKHRNLAVSPTSPTTVYATAGSMLFRSTDGGASWQRINRTADAPLHDVIHALAIDPQIPSTVYTAQSNCIVYKSVDGGTRWTSTTTGLPEQCTISRILVDPQATATLYALTTDETLYKSVDGGQIWQLAKQFNAVVQVGLDPHTPTTVYALIDSRTYETWTLQKSVDGGKTWQVATANRAGTGRAIVVDPSDSATLFVLTRGNGVYKSGDSGRTWTNSTIDLFPFGGLTTLVVDPVDRQHLFVGSEFEAHSSLWESTDGGMSWQLVKSGLPNGLRIRSLATEGRHPQWFYAATQTGVYVYTTGASNSRYIYLPLVYATDQNIKSASQR